MKKIKLVLILLLFPAVIFAQQKKIMVMEIKSEIDAPMKRYVQLALMNAEKQKSDAVIIEMDTYGGVMTDAKEIVDFVMRYKNPVFVFINRDAASAGALISIACDSIYMTSGATIGSATVVDQNGQKAPDKYQAYMRSIMRSTAEANGRDPRIAEGMVDEDIVIEGVKEAGKIISFTTSEALKHGFCEAQVSSIEDILARNNITDYTIERFELGVADSIIAIFLNPFISGILILIILAGIYFEMQTPGLGFAGLAALVALILYLVPYYLNGIAENWEIISFFIGIVLIAVEIFVLPGFGIAGVSGIVLVIGSLVLVMLNNDNFDFQFVSANDILRALAAALGGLLGAGIAAFVIGARLPHTRFFNRVALVNTQDSDKGYTVNTFKGSLLGKKGITHTVLRPSGKVIIDDIIYDAYTRGDYIEKGQVVEVVSDDDGTTLKVKSAE